MPKVSILVSTYNDCLTLEESLKSIRDQTFKDFECLVINDASVDATRELLDGISRDDQRFVIIHNTLNKGLVCNLQALLEKASGEYIARLDTDDVWVQATKLEEQVALLDLHPSLGLVGTGALAESVNQKQSYVIRPRVQDSDIRKEMLFHNPFVHSSILARKSCVVEVGGYRDVYPHVEDYDLWLRLGAISEFANIPTPLVLYRVRLGSITEQNNEQQIKACIALVKLHKKGYPFYTFAILKWYLQLTFPGVLGGLRRKLFRYV